MAYTESIITHPQFGEIQTVPYTDPVAYTAEDLAELLSTTDPDSLGTVEGSADIYRLSAPLGPFALRWVSAARAHSSIPVDITELQAHMEWFASELQVLRNLGVKALAHTAFSLELDPYNYYDPGLPSVFIVTEKLATSDTLEDHILESRHLAKWHPPCIEKGQLVSRALMQYYDPNDQRPRLTEPGSLCQYAPDGRLMDLDPYSSALDSELTIQDRYNKVRNFSSA